MTSLAAHPQGLPFTELKELCALTDGNLNRHLHVLHAAGLVDIRKGRDGRRPQTLVRLTDLGRRQFTEYLAVLEGVVSEALEAAQAGRGVLRHGWSPA
jgi:DNA-binding MarR family transcriptional regulator